MTPLSTQLPAPVLEFVADMNSPITGAFAPFRFGEAVNQASVSRSRPARAQTPAATIAPLGNTGLAGTTDELGGRTCVLTTSAGAIQGSGWRTELWQPGYDAAGFNPGAFYDAPSVVATIDWSVALTQLAFTGAADVSGFWFQPRANPTQNLPTGAPGGASPVGGFGVAMNDDGGGNNQWEFVSYDNTGTILLRTVIGSSFVADVLEWTTFRFTIIAAASGRPANLTLDVNGLPVSTVQTLEFDDVVLMRPETSQSGALGFFYGQALGIMGGAGYRHTLYGRFGRFTVGGAEIQPV